MTSNTRHYEYKSSKFWEININGCVTTVGYGPIGATPRLSKKTHKDITAAEEFAEKMTKEKMKKGYVLVPTASEEEENKKNVGNGAKTIRKRKMTNHTEEEDDDVAEADNSSGSNKFVWQYYMDVPMDGREAGWHFYDENVSNALEKEFSKGRTSWQTKSGYFKYEIDIGSMTQRNMTSGTTRSIRRWNKNDEKVSNIQNGGTSLRTRRYEYGSSKFWEITINGCATRIGYGAIGASPRVSEKKHKSVTDAEEFAEKMIGEKVKKGYVLVITTNTEEDNEKNPPPKKMKIENDDETKNNVDNENSNLTKKQRYEFGDPAHKFWEIKVHANSTLISYGTIGSYPKNSNVDHTDSITAEKFAKKKIEEKISKGYYEVLALDDDNSDDNDNANIIVEKEEEDGNDYDKADEGKNIADDSITSTSLRRFEYGNPATKFWEISINDRETIVNYGPMGEAKGRESKVEHKDATAATKFSEKKINEKTKKGYIEVETTAKTAAAAAAATTTSTESRTGPLDDGEDREVEGSAVNPYTVSRRGNIYSCTCPGWRFQRTNITFRSCKHLRHIQGEEFENARVGSSLPAGNQGKNNASKKLPIPSVMLAHKYEPDKHEKSLVDSHDANNSGEQQWYMSEKLDGLRAIWDGKTFLSRTGNVFYAPEEFTKDFPKDIVLDGELFCGRGNFDLAVSLVRSIGGSYEQWKESVTYEIFEAPLLGGKNLPFEDRIEKIKEVAKTMKHARFVAQEPVRSPEHLNEKLASVEADDGEGLMLRRKGSKYEYRRSTHLLKVKTMHDAEAEVIGYEEGKGKHADKTGALICKLPLSGKRFKVGSGLTDKQRLRPPKIGSVITFRYFEMTKGGIPRFPTFKCVYNA